MKTTICHSGLDPESTPRHPERSEGSMLRFFAPLRMTSMYWIPAFAGMTQRTNILLSGLILGTLLFLVPNIGFASGIQVSPDKLQFEPGSKTQTKEIVVANPTGDVQLFEIYADDFSEAITSNPSTFTLEAGDRKRVVVTIQPSKLNSELTKTNLSVVAKPLAESKVQINTGVKIPIIIATDQAWYRNFIVPIAIAVLLMTIGVNFYRTRKRKPA